MRKRITITLHQNFSKPAIEVLKTAGRKGMKIPLVDDGYLWTDVETVPFSKAFTRREINDTLRQSRIDNNLTMAKLVKGSGRFSDMDSLNMSHAGAYYEARIWVYEDEAIRAELVEDIS